MEAIRDRPGRNHSLRRCGAHWQYRSAAVRGRCVSRTPPHPERTSHPLHKEQHKGTAGSDSRSCRCHLSERRLAIRDQIQGIERPQRIQPRAANELLGRKSRPSTHLAATHSRCAAMCVSTRAEGVVLARVLCLSVGVRYGLRQLAASLVVGQGEPPALAAMASVSPGARHCSGVPLDGASESDCDPGTTGSISTSVPKHAQSRFVAPKDQHGRTCLPQSDCPFRSRPPAPDVPFGVAQSRRNLARGVAARAAIRGFSQARIRLRSRLSSAPQLRLTIC
jgi:hypothetical protein